MFKKVFLGTVPIAKIYLGDKLIKYNIVTSIPPKFLGTVPDFTADVNKAIEMHYVASDDVGVVRHEFYDGSTWRDIYPTIIENIHYYTLTFDTVGDKQCQIRITDADGNVVTSNIFTLSVKQAVRSELIYASDIDNQIYALNRTDLQKVHSIGASGAVGDILRMGDMLYVADGATAKITGYNERLERQKEVPGTSLITDGLCGVLSTSASENYLYITDTSAIHQYKHIDLNKLNTKNDGVGFKCVTQHGNRVFALRQNNSVLVLNSSLEVIKEIPDTTQADFIMVDDKYIYKYPNAFGTCKKFDIATSDEVATGMNSLSLLNGYSLGDYLLLVGESRTGIYLVNKTDFSRSKNKYMPTGIGSVDVDPNTNLIYMGSLDGTLHVLDLNTWQYVTSQKISSTQITNITVGREE